MKIVRALLFATLLLPMSSVAIADVREGSRTVKSGELTQILIHSNYGSECEGGDRPSIKLVRAPKHGSIKTGPGVEKVEKNGNPCDGKEIEGTAIFYQSDPGYIGTDEFTYHRLRSGKNSETLFTIKATIIVE